MIKEYLSKLDLRTKQDFFAASTAALEQGTRLFVVTANPETLMLAEKVPEMRDALLDPATVIVPDGIGVVRAAQSLDLPVYERVPGVEIAEHLLSEANRLKSSVFLYGATEEVLSALKKRLAHEWPELILVGAKNGYDFDDDAVFSELADRSPDVVLVALGVPRQEILLHRHLSRLDKGVLVGVGGSFDVLSKTVRRAPRLFQKLGLEWLWRILRNPSRLKRFLASNLPFLAEVRRLKKEKKNEK
ncbi:MAG: WecB/TagA/CpsF family glycosyltransferase [Clostridia bacterium]|nr:WecB/TagA/CpsF family glycosyltransferase [Clostridia bacterium]